jgi:hypothetical protein
MQVGLSVSLKLFHNGEICHYNYHFLLWPSLKFIKTTTLLKSIIFWDTMPCSPLKFNHFWGTNCLHLQGLRISPARYHHESKWEAEPPGFTIVSCLAYSSTLKMEAICSSETWVYFQRTTWHYVPDDSTHHNHCYENLKSHITLLLSLFVLQMFL